MRDLWQDIRYGARRLARTPGFTAAAVLTLALGIGATSSIFSLLRAVLFEALPYKDPGSLVLVRGLMTREAPEDWPISWLDIHDLRAEQKVFSGLAAIGDDMTYNLGSTGEPEHVAGEMVTADYFDLLGLRPAVGRTFLAAEDRPPGEARVMILGHDLWKRRFGGDRGIVGRAVQLNEEPYTVVGVMPPGFRGLTDVAEVWLPAGISGSTLGAHYIEMRRYRWMFAAARLAPGVSVERAQQELDTIFARMAQEYPDSNEHFSLRLEPLSEAWFGDLRPQLLVALGAAAFVLLIACTNVANLLLARAAGRQKEMSVRSALGAGRGRLVRQLLAESLVLSLLGCALGLLLAWWATGLLAGSGAITLRSFVHPRIDLEVAVVTVALALLCGLLFGLAPAVLATRINLQSGLKEGALATTSAPGRRRFQGSLVIAEVGLALALLTGAGLMIKGFQQFLQTDLGLRPEGVLTMQLDLTGERFADSDLYRTVVGQLYDRLSALPGVESAALEGPGIPTGEWNSASFSLEDQPDLEPVSFLRHHVTPRYFETLGIPLLAGRDFTPQDIHLPGVVGIPVMVVSEALAKRYWPGGARPGENALGKRLKPGPRDSPVPWFTIVGIVRDVNHRGLGGQVQTDPDLYMAVLQSPARSPTRLAVLVRSTQPPSSLIPQVRQAIREVAPSLTAYDVRTLQDRLSKQTARGSALVRLMTVLAGIALLLAIVGIYGLLSYTVTQRVREIGVRMALGADRGRVVGLVVRGALALIAAGLVLGLLAVLLLNRFLTSLLYGVSPTDPGTLAATALLLLGVALAASCVPALQATRISPVTALRME
ncbi:MAG TPA: ABC transporter permease [Thermoanaerobaculia bacterium]|nr:ABC transporter permease [Thermoanaerobaculia bacterium]